MSVVHKMIVTDDLTGEIIENRNYITVNFFWTLVSGSSNTNEWDAITPDPVGTFISYANALTWASNRLLNGGHFMRGENVWALEKVWFAETRYDGQASLMLKGPVDQCSSS